VIAIVVLFIPLTLYTIRPVTALILIGAIGSLQLAYGLAWLVADRRFGVVSIRGQRLAMAVACYGAFCFVFAILIRAR
jgi:hypothetical protein